jgi:hypothetical protein
MQRLIILTSDNGDSSYQAVIGTLLSSPSSLAVLRHVSIHTDQSLLQNLENASATLSGAGAEVLKMVLDSLLDPSNSFSELRHTQPSFTLC